STNHNQLRIQEIDQNGESFSQTSSCLVDNLAGKLIPLARSIGYIFCRQNSVRRHLTHKGRNFTFLHSHHNSLAGSLRHPAATCPPLDRSGLVIANWS